MTPLGTPPFALQPRGHFSEGYGKKDAGRLRPRYLGSMRRGMLNSGMKELWKAVTSWLKGSPVFDWNRAFHLDIFGTFFFLHLKFKANQFNGLKEMIRLSHFAHRERSFSTGNFIQLIIGRRRHAIACLATATVVKRNGYVTDIPFRARIVPRLRML
ncbi:hypothetical protein CEXT_531341 [Caerostris extrusa]|uniref:Uncharacterized protein n=1 Tax=Caerostris extrusa TaxID=172846 RepID=A0AAV4Y4F3_CAEEX|nr:hypothetical protein CEXT_531341 [Caerostris extrusa]